MTGTVFNIQRYSVHDGPGIRTTVFLKGCPLRCLWCHNPESMSREKEVVYREDRCLRCGDCIGACPHGAIADVEGVIVTSRERCMRCGSCLETCSADAREIIGRMMSAADVMQEVMKDAAFFEESGGGVTFSGGEPLLQHEFLLELLKAAKQRGLHTAVDTTGYASSAVFRGIMEWADLALYDVKMMDEEKHREYTGVSNRVILQNLRDLAVMGKTIVVRIPVIPGVNDDEANIDATGAFLASLPSVKEVHLLPYHETGREKYARLGRTNPMASVQPASNNLMNAIAVRLTAFGPPVVVGG